MESYLVYPSGPLTGSIDISGAKNAVLPLMAATLLCRGISTIHNAPKLDDVATMAELLRHLGAKVKHQQQTLIIDTRDCEHHKAPYHLVSKMRASIYVLGPLLARLGKASVAMPGGCAWGPRPVDLHIKAMQSLAAQVHLEHGNIHAHSGRLQGCDFSFTTVSVGATANMLMAAVLAKGTTRLFNAAIEPEIDNLIDQLNAMGAQIFGKGSHTLVIEGVETLTATSISAIPDRIEAGTYLIAAAITQGNITLQQVEPKHLKALTNKLIAAGAQISSGDSSISINASKRPLKPISITTGPYPQFATDLQPQWLALVASLKGAAQVKDMIYQDRFQHVPEFVRLGAKIRLQGNIAAIIGNPALSGAQVSASDLRAGAALVLLGLIADGHTQIHNIYHLDRGYQDLTEKMSRLGASIQRLGQEPVLTPVRLCG